MIIVNDDFYIDESFKKKQFCILNKKQKDKIMSYVNSIPKEYKRNEYIIDKLNCKKKNVDNN